MKTINVTDKQSRVIGIEEFHMTDANDFLSILCFTYRNVIKKPINDCI